MLCSVLIFNKGDIFMVKHTSHKEKRKLFFEKIPDYWADMYGQEYSLYDVHPIKHTFVEETKVFAKRVGQIFWKTAELLRTKEIADQTLLEMGYPKETIDFIRLDTLQSKTVIGRLDSVNVNGVHKVIEFNADTPTFIYELFKINGQVCKDFGLTDPNDGQLARLKKAVNQAILSSCRYLETPHMPNIVFTSHQESIEDRNTVLFLKSLTDIPTQYLALDQLRIIEGEALIDTEGNKIDVLYRQTFPIENLILDEDPDTNEKVGLQLLQLVREKKLALINPPSAFLLQNKAVMAIIWGLYEEGSPFFTEEEHEWIGTHFLPTYLEADPFMKSKEMYVKKPVFGREGDTVEIHGPSGDKVIEDKNKSYQHYDSVFQKYVELPTTSFQTEGGIKEGHMMVGTFLVDGEPSAFGFRVGNKITDNLSYFLPVGTKKNV
jgi:glutathionylspermidine synthase